MLKLVLAAVLLTAFITSGCDRVTPVATPMGGPAESAARTSPAPADPEPAHATAGAPATPPTVVPRTEVGKSFEDLQKVMKEAAGVTKAIHDRFCKPTNDTLESPGPQDVNHK